MKNWIVFILLFFHGFLYSSEIKSEKSFFISGVAGFIGYSLADSLLDLGYEVYGCDNLNDYYDVNLKMNRLKQLKYKGLHFTKIDIRDISELKNLFLEKKFSDFIHLAAQAGVRYSLTNPDTYIESNVDGFLQVLELCKDFQSMRLIYASSSSVYGNISEYPQHEEMNVSSPNSLYSATKIANELFAKVYHHVYGINSIGLRFFTVYGPWGRPDMAHFIFANSIVNRKEITLFNHGEMYRDFTYIDDIIDGIIGVIFSDLTFEIINLGKGQPDKVADLVCLLEQELDVKAIIASKPLSKVEVYKTYADVFKARNLIGYNPKTDLPTGVSKYVKWYQEYYGRKSD